MLPKYRLYDQLNTLTQFLNIYKYPFQTKLTLPPYMHIFPISGTQIIKIMELQLKLTSK